MNAAEMKIYYEAVDKQLNEFFARNLELETEDGSFNYIAYLMADANINLARLATTLQETVSRCKVRNLCSCLVIYLTTEYTEVTEDYIYVLL